LGRRNSRGSRTPIPSVCEVFVKNPEINIRGLTRRFAQATAVDHIDLTVCEGDIFGLLGANGAGKTTVIKMLTTLLGPSAGSATVAGFDIVSQAHEVRRRIGYVPQMLSADGALTGYENLLLSARLYGVAEQRTRIEEALAFMGLSEYAGRLVKTYSGGMVRRLEIAQSMLHRPAVLFLDEPTIGLDPVARRAVWVHLKELNKDYHITILLTTHDMEEADNLCNDVAVMHTGQIAAHGSPEALKARVGKQATLEDVFTRFSGELEETGRLRDTAETRSSARHRG
jgi:ABC-2 type transport system ATP-binding protein